MRDRLPADQAITQALVDEITRLDSERADLTTGYLEDNLFTSEHPALVWPRECINHAVIRYIDHSAIDYAVDWHLQGWANVNRFGDYHNLHNHPHAWLPVRTMCPYLIPRLTCPDAPIGPRVQFPFLTPGPRRT